MLDLSTKPYFDDAANAIANNYSKIMFVPGNAVQARELTQIQSLLQEQIKRFGDAIYKNGTVIVPGHTFYDNTVTYLQMQPSYNGTSVDAIGSQLIGKELRGTSGVVAHVVHYEPSTTTDAPTLFVKYVAGAGTVQSFVLSEVLTSADFNVSMQIQSTTNAIGQGSICSISDGIYYVNGYFVGVSAHTIALDKYSATPSFVVGLSYVENIVTAAQDPSLYDNAIGSANYSAEGADRYQIKLQLSKQNADYSPIAGQALLNFIPLTQVLNGVVQYNNDSTAYSNIEKMLAKRTYDEAGDYVVRPFSFAPKNFRSNNRGTWTATTPYLADDVMQSGSTFYMALNNGYSGSTAPTHTFGQALDGSVNWLQVNTPSFNGGVYQTTSTAIDAHVADEGKMIVQASGGKAYIKGFAVDIQNNQNITVQKARDVEQKTLAHIYAPAGDYVTITNVTGIVDTSSMTQINLLDATSVVRGTAYATTMEYVSGTIGTTAATYKLYLLYIQMNIGYDFRDDIVSFTSTVGTTLAGSFVQRSEIISGVVNTTSASAAIVGIGTLFTQQVKAGDNVLINGVAKVVLSITDDTHMTLTTTMATTASAVNIMLQVVDLISNGSFIQPMPSRFIRNLRKADGTLDTSYVVEKTISFTTVGTSYVYTLTTPGETFLGNASYEYVTVRTDTNAVINATYALDVTSTILTISGLTAAIPYKIIAMVNRAGNAAKEKSKTLNTATIIVNSGNVTDAYGNVLSTAWNYTSMELPLFKCDAFSLCKVTMSGTTGAYNATGESDVTSYFKLNVKNNPTYYDICTVTRDAKKMITPSKALKITFQYFEHSAGDYFSVNSYAGIPYDKIPSEIQFGITYNLRDCLDFRSRINDAGTGFTGTGGNISAPISSATNITTSYSYYLPRIDVIALNADGNFEYVMGKSDVNPVEPSSSHDALKMATIADAPYTFNPVTDVKVTDTPHPVYTMADIAKMDARLTNVETKVALTQLERQTVNTVIYDSNGVARYKSGFVVDGFNDLKVSDISSSEYRAQVDAINGVVGPTSVATKVPLIEPAGTTNVTRLASGYQVTGEWVTLPYTEVSLVTQPIGSHAENINPFSVFSWNGTATISPQVDNWVDFAANDVTGTTIVNRTANTVYRAVNLPTIMIAWTQSAPTRRPADDISLGSR